MEKLRSTLKKQSSGYGHNRVSIMLKDGTILSTVTNNTIATDAAFDPNYNEDEDTIKGNRFIESREEAQDSLIYDIIEHNWDELTDEQWESLPKEFRKEWYA